MRLIPTILAILGIVGIVGGIVTALVIFKPEAKKEEREKALEWVEVMEVKMENVELQIPSQGLVQPVTETVATSEVAGQIKTINPKFEVGREFSAGDVLLELDDTDYQAALAQAKAEKAAAELELELEKSRQAQAIRDWEELGGGRDPSKLAKREPQVAAAQARVDAATKAVERAEKDVERTKLVAAYDGRVRSKSIDVGSFVTMGSRLGEFYSTKHYEVRLPISLDNFAFVDIYAPGESVTLNTQISGEKKEWKAKILRTEGQVDRASRSVYVVAGLEGKDGPFSRDNLLAPDLFVEAEIKGMTLEGVVKLPRRAFVKPDEVLIVKPGNKLDYRKVKVEHRDRDYMYVSGGLNSGEKICTTALAAVTKDMQVRVLGEETPEEADPEEEPDKVPTIEGKRVEGEAEKEEKSKLGSADPEDAADSDPAEPKEDTGG